MASSDYIAINGTRLPTPKQSGLTIDKEKIWASNTGRASNGEMIGDMVGIKYKLKCEWPPLTREEVSQIDALVSIPYFSLSFKDPGTDTRRTIIAYAGTPTYPVYSYADGQKTFQGVAVDFIEK